MRLKTVRLTILASVAATLATGCVTAGMSSTVKSAPITYKVGQGDANYASLDYAPRDRRGPQGYDLPGGQGFDFDPDDVDRSLYSHMKVGKRYTIMGQTFTPRHDPDYNRVGTASWYGPKFHGKPTANGETFNKRAMTAAHPTLALNSLVRVTNLENGRAVTVRLNDRGPFIDGRMIDMSEAAAEALDFKRQGTVKVRVQYIGPADPAAATRTLPRSAPRVAELPRTNLTPAPRPQSLPLTPPKATPLSQPLYSPAPAPTPAPAPLPRQAERRAPPAAPAQPARRPQADLPSGGNVTMTIKGPIHLAKSTEADPEPEFISEAAKTR